MVTRIKRLQMAVPILMYHQVSRHVETAYARFTVTPQQLKQQMRWLADRGFSSVTLDDVVASRVGSKALPSKPMVITFDDGCRECVDHATTILAAHGFAATFFLVAGSMGATTAWTKARLNIELPIIDWRTAASLIKQGFSIGSHTVSHRPLADLCPEERDDELRRSRAILEDHLGQEVVHLAYPHGSYNEDVILACRAAGYRTACTTQGRLASPSDSLLALPRLGVYGQDSLLNFRLRVRTGKRVDELLPRPIYLLLSSLGRLTRITRRLRH
jgi:peptidoglycan/xylan/chitin deacetylase (PgdA/CDA1 family)